jgi:hypothetical protein
VYRGTTNVLNAIVFSGALLSLPITAHSQPADKPDSARTNLTGASRSANTAGSSTDLVRAVKEMRDDLRELRLNVASLRQLLESETKGSPVTEPKRTTDKHLTDEGRAKTRTYFGNITTRSLSDKTAKVAMISFNPVEAEQIRADPDSPTPYEVIRSLPDEDVGSMIDAGSRLLGAIVQTKNEIKVKIVVEPILDRVTECRFYPVFGRGRMKQRHYKCQVVCDKEIRSDWPISFMNRMQTRHILYIDYDHLIRCTASGASP